MNNFTVELYTPTGAAAPLDSLTLSVSYYSAKAHGGSYKAELEVSGPQDALWDVLGYLGYFAVVRNGNGTAVWSGYVDDASVTVASSTVGVSLEEMYNAVAVAYTYVDAAGEDIRDTTEWAEDADSIRRFGRKEILLSMSDVKKEQAEQRRDAELAAYSRPMPYIEPHGGETRATLYCKGLWEQLGWRLYENPLGKETHEPHTDLDHMLGWSLTDTSLGFFDRSISDYWCRLHHITRDHRAIAHAGANTGTYAVKSAAREEEQVSAVFGNVTFDPSDDIHHPAEQFGMFTRGSLLRIEGALLNAGYYFARTVGAEHMTLRPATIVDEGPVSGVTITQGNSIEVERSSPFALALPGQSVTLDVEGLEVAQAFYHTEAEAWTLREVCVYVERSGEHYDDLAVDICADGVNRPGTRLGGGTISGADIRTVMDWASCTLAQPVLLQPGVTYWLKVRKTGAYSPEHYYRIGMETDCTYERGHLRVWDRGAWQLRTPQAELAFQCWGQEKTTDQLYTILTRCGRFAGVDVRVDSAIYTRQWRNGDLYAIDEAQELLDSGTESGPGSAGMQAGLVAYVGADRIVRVEQEPDPSPTDPLWLGGGKLSDALGGPWETGVLPVGRWVRVADLPAHVSHWADVGRFFVAEAEYDVQRNMYTLTARGRPSVWEGA